MKVLGISGSLRKASFNTALLRAAQTLAPEGMTIVEHSLADIPLYNDDVRLAGYPDAVRAFREAIASADALLIVTPEYNFSVPGVLKNAIDWASRPPDQPLAQKPLAIMSTATGMLGGARAQYHLRQIAVFVDLLPVNKPEVIVPRAADKFDAELRLTDEATRTAVKSLLEALGKWVSRLGRAGA
jgi:chromate reductase, NAD(P)H dehydrogenase (quinone)